MNKITVQLFAFLWMLPGMLGAQTLAIETLAATGETFNLTSGEAIVWTVGEVAVENYANQTTLSQGFHQGYGLATPVYEAPFSSIQIRVFPNPASEFVIVETDTPSEVQAKLFDLYGRLLQQQTLNGQQAQIDLGNLPAGAYLLSIQDEQGLVHSYSIQKINF